MFGIGSKNKQQIPILATQTGKVVKLEDVPDDVFAQKILGDGIAIYPESELVCSPVSGTVVSVAGTLHAICITADDETGFLVHVGIDTVSLKGKGFELMVREGDKVDAGDPILRANLSLLSDNGYHIHTPTVIAEMDGITLSYENVRETIGGKTVVAYYQRA